MRRDMAALCRACVAAVAVRLVSLSTGRRSRHLFVGLHVADAVQSPLLHLPARPRLRSAGRRAHVLLLGHLPLHHSLVEGDDAPHHDDGRAHDDEQDDHVVPAEETPN